MIDASAVQATLNRLVPRVKYIDRHAGQRLEHLSVALSDPVEAKIWAETDLYQMIDPDSLAERYQPWHERLAEILEVIRNVAIFLPILFTWLGIAFASNAYHELLNQCLKNCPDQVSQPFLYLWEQGFNNKTFPDYLRLSQIGKIDAVLLGGIFLITLYISIFSGQSKRTFRTELINALADASFLLRGQSSLIVSPVHNLDNIAQRMVIMSDKLLAQFTDLKTALNQVTDQIQSQFQATQSANNDLLQKIGGFNSLITTLLQAGANFERAGQAVSAQILALVQPIQTMINQQKGMLGQLNQATNSLQDAAGQLGSIKQGQDFLTRSITDTLDQQSDVIGRLDAVSNNLNRLDDQLGEFLHQLQKESQVQTEQSESVVAAGQSLKETLAYTGEEAIQIRNVAWEMHHVVEVLTNLADSSGVNFITLVENYDKAAQLMNQSASNLENSSNNLDRLTLIIYNAAQDLRSAAATLSNSAAAENAATNQPH